MRFNHILRSTASVAVVGVAAFGLVGAAAAQDGPTTVDDIIVTAQKREQSLQDVPIVVTTLSQEALDGAGVRDIKDLQILTPGMTVTSTQSETATTARIRGVGFTMSLFIGVLAFPGAVDSPEQIEVKLGVIGGSLLSGLAAAVILNLASRRQQQREDASSAKILR